MILLVAIAGTSGLAMLCASSVPAMADGDTTPIAMVADTLSNTVTIIDMDDDSIIATIPGIDTPAGLALGPNTSRLYVTDSGSDNVTIIDIARSRPIGTIPVGRSPYGIALSPDESIAYVTNNQDNTVSIIDLSKGKVNATVNVGRGPYGIKVNPVNGDAYVVNSDGRTVSVIRGHDVVATIPAGYGTTKGIDITPDGSFLLVADTYDNYASIINTTTFKIAGNVSTGEGPDGIAVSPDGWYAYIANRGSGNISILQLSDRTIRVSLNASNPGGIAFRQDGKAIYVSTAKAGKVLAMNSATGDVKATFDVRADDLEAGSIGSSSVADRTPPATTLTLNGTMDADGAYIGEVTCNLTAVDYPSLTEAKNIQYSLDGNVWSTYPGNFTIKSPRIISVYYRATDKAGNVEAVKAKTIEIVAQAKASPPGASPGTILPPKPTALPEDEVFTVTPQATATAKPSSGFEAILAAAGMASAIYAIGRKK